ncbi:alpha/beta hydrolase family protein [Sessilibacter corallicola]|uniref:Alpha/beta hydrolase n=1 Tax=Sessilibacter corallicola TaxID=2904075 RepID=A0ABQ0A4X5_9GAMM
MPNAYIPLFSTPPPPSDFIYPYGDQQSQFGQLRIPKDHQKHPVIINFHGGWWRAKHDLNTQSYFCQALTQQGFATWNVEYTRIGENQACWPNTFQDVANAVDFLRSIEEKHNLDLNRVITLGFSAGAPLALWAASRSIIKPTSPLYTKNPLTVAGAVSLAGAIDLQECSTRQLSDSVVDQFMGGNYFEKQERYQLVSPAEFTLAAIPHLIIHGKEDTSVPYSISESFYQKARENTSATIDLCLFDNCEHFDLIDPGSVFWPQILKKITTLYQKIA